MKRIKVWHKNGAVCNGKRRREYQEGIIMQRNIYRAVRVTKGILYSMFFQPFTVCLIMVGARKAPKLHNALKCNYTK